MNLSKIRLSITHKYPDSVPEKPQQPRLETPKKMKVYREQQTTIDRTQNFSNRNSINSKLQETQPVKRYIKIMQSLDKNLPENKRVRTPSADSRKILTVQAIKKMNTTQEDQDLSRSKSKQKLRLTESTLKFEKIQPTEVTILNKDSKECMSVNELMAQKRKKVGKELSVQTPIHLITEENYFSDKSPIFA